VSLCAFAGLCLSVCMCVCVCVGSCHLGLALSPIKFSQIQKLGRLDSWHDHLHFSILFSVLVEARQRKRRTRKRKRRTRKRKRTARQRTRRARQRTRRARQRKMTGKAPLAPLPKKALLPRGAAEESMSFFLSARDHKPQKPDCCCMGFLWFLCRSLVEEAEDQVESLPGDIALGDLVRKGKVLNKGVCVLVRQTKYMTVIVLESKLAEDGQREYSGPFWELPQPGKKFSLAPTGLQKAFFVASDVVSVLTAGVTFYNKEGEQIQADLQTRKRGVKPCFPDILPSLRYLRALSKTKQT